MSELTCDFCYNKNKLILLKTSIKDKKRYNGCCHCWQKASLYNCLKELPAYKGIGIGNRVWVVHTNPYTNKIEKSKGIVYAVEITTTPKGKLYIYYCWVQIKLDKPPFGQTTKVIALENDIYYRDPENEDVLDGWDLKSEVLSEPNPKLFTHIFVI